MQSPGSDTSTDLARERSRAAADRTLMAWIRTALALIGFGFTIAKLGDFVETRHPDIRLDPVRSMTIFGGVFLLLGVVSLVAAVIQHGWILKSIDAEDYTYVSSRPLAVSVSIVLIATAVFGLLVIFL